MTKEGVGLETANQFGSDYFELGKGASYKDGYARDTVVGYWKDVIEYLVQEHQPSCALEIGCAKGFLVHELRNKGVQCYGVDISQYALSKAPSAVKPFLHQADLCSEQLPFEAEAFDLIFCLETIEHLRNPEKLIDEIARILKSDGVFFFTTPSPGSDVAKADVTHVNVRSLRQWKYCFEKTGFRLSELQPWIWSAHLGRLGHLSEPLRTLVRKIIYPMLLMFRRKRHLYLLGRKKPRMFLHK